MTDKGKMIEAVYKADLSKRATLVIFYLINRANKDLTCFPGIKTIAADCNMSDRTVRRALDDLVGSGFVKKESRYRDNGGQSSNLYTLILEMETEIEKNETKLSLNTHRKSTCDGFQFESIDFFDIASEPISSMGKCNEVETNENELNQLRNRQPSLDMISSRSPSDSRYIECSGKLVSNFLCQGEDDSLIPP